MTNKSLTISSDPEVLLQEQLRLDMVENLKDLVLLVLMLKIQTKSNLN